MPRRSDPVYLDHNAGAPMRPDVRDAMITVLQTQEMPLPFTPMAGRRGAGSRKPAKRWPACAVPKPGQ